MKAKRRKKAVRRKGLGGVYALTGDPEDLAVELNARLGEGDCGGGTLDLLASVFGTPDLKSAEQNRLLRKFQRTCVCKTKK